MIICEVRVILHLTFGHVWADKEMQSKLGDFELLQKQYAALQEANKASVYQQQTAIAQKEKLDQELGELRKTHAITEKELADAGAKIKSLNNTLKQDAKQRMDLEEKVSKLKEQVADLEAIKVDLGMTKSRAQAAEAAAQTAQTEAVEHANRAAERLKDLELSRDECKAAKDAAETYSLKASNADAEAAKVKKELAAREKDLAEFKEKEKKKIERMEAEVERLRAKAAVAAKVNDLEASVKAKDKELVSTRLQQNEQQKLHAKEVEALKQVCLSRASRPLNSPHTLPAPSLPPPFSLPSCIPPRFWQLHLSVLFREQSQLKELEANRLELSATQLRMQEEISNLEVGDNVCVCLSLCVFVCVCVGARARVEGRDPGTRAGSGSMVTICLSGVTYGVGSVLVTAGQGWGGGKIAGDGKQPEARAGQIE